MSPNSCSGPVGRVFPEACRATGFVSTSASTVSTTACECSLFNTYGALVVGGGEFASSLKPLSLSVVSTTFWSVAVHLVFLWASSGSSPFVRLSLESSHRGRRHGAISCEVWQRGCCDMQVAKTGKLHSTFLVRAVVGDLFKGDVFSPLQAEELMSERLRRVHELLNA